MDFEVVGGHVGLPAGAGRIVLLAQAEQAGVAALGVRDREAPAAHPTVQQPLRVVRVLALAGPSCRPGAEQFLDPAEHLGGDQRLVGSRVLDPVPLHHADVDRVGEDLDRRCGSQSEVAERMRPRLGAGGDDLVLGPVKAAGALVVGRQPIGVWVAWLMLRRPLQRMPRRSPRRSRRRRPVPPGRATRSSAGAAATRPQAPWRPGWPGGRWTVHW